MSLAWTKFYWSDWESDPALRLCSYGAQGLWMRMLCIAAAHDPIGYVAVAGRALDPTSLARMTGGMEGEVQTLLGELERNGVFSRDRHRRIYSRRMIRDARKAAEARKNGKLGGNPSLGKDEGIPASDNPSDKGGDKPQKLEARSQRVSEEEKSSSADPVPSMDYDGTAWKAAMLLLTDVGKMTDKSARGLFGRLLAQNGLEARDLLPAIMSAQVQGTRDPQAYLTKSAQGIAKRRAPTKQAVGFV